MGQTVFGNIATQLLALGPVELVVILVIVALFVGLIVLLVKAFSR
jgi:hypothetical protein